MDLQHGQSMTRSEIRHFLSRITELLREQPITPSELCANMDVPCRLLLASLILYADINLDEYPATPSGWAVICWELWVVSGNIFIAKYDAVAMRWVFKERFSKMRLDRIG